MRELLHFLYTNSFSNLVAKVKEELLELSKNFEFKALEDACLNYRKCDPNDPIHTGKKVSNSTGRQFSEI